MYPKNKKLIIEADRYRELLEAEHELKALNFGGVNNWEWHWTAIQDYIQEYVDNDPYFLSAIRNPGETDEYVLDDIDLKTIADYEIEIIIELQEEENAST